MRRPRLPRPGGYFDYDIRYPSDPGAAVEATVLAFLDRADTRADIHAASLADKPSVGTGGRYTGPRLHAGGSAHTGGGGSVV